MTTETLNLLDCARRVIDMEAEAVLGLKNVLGPCFEQAIALMLACKGRIVCTGMGKAGHVARKVAATLASTGSPSFYMHPAEALHGDLGMITADDMAIAFSHQGQTEEVLRVVSFLKHIGAPLIAITSNPASELARQAECALVISIKQEACPLGLAPTSSTTAMLALGDTLAMVLLEARGFKSEDYALFHPGGSLGRRLLTKVADLMHTGDDNPVVPASMPFREALVVLAAKKLAAISIVDADGRLIGFFSSGDLTRYMLRGQFNLDQPIERLMTPSPKYARPGMMAVKALEILREYKIIQLPVCDETLRPIGMVHLHDITRAGIS